MTIGLTDLLDLAISPEIGPVNFFHLRNLLHSIVNHFGIGEIRAKQAETRLPRGVSSSSGSSSPLTDSDEDETSESEEESDSEDDGHVSEQEVTQTIIDEQGQEQTVVVKVAKPKREKSASKEKSERREQRKKSKTKDPSAYGEKERKKSRHHDTKKEESGKDGKKSSSKEGRKQSVYGGDYGDSSAYSGKLDKKKREKKLSMDNIGETAEIINLSRRMEAVENGIKSLRNIIDSMVNQVDFGDEVGGVLKAQLEQVQQQMNKVELVPQETPGTKKEKKKRKESKAKAAEEVPADGMITESPAAAGAPSNENVVGVIPPPGAGRPTQDMPKLQPGRTPSRGRKVSVPLKGEQKGADRPPSQGEKPPMRKRTTLRDLQLRKKAREEGITVEELEAKEAAQEGEKKAKPQKSKEKKKKEDENNNKDKDSKEGKDKDDDDASSSEEEESVDSAEEDAAMDEMIMEEIEAALENADDPEAQLYALRLGIEQMTNMKRNFSQAQDEFRRDMDKNRKAIEQISKDLASFRAARKAQDAEGFNAVHHVHSIVLELQAKHEKLVSTTAELVNEYNRREKSLEELFGGLDRLEQTKADKLNVTKEIGIKADKMDLDSKVSTNQFDESFTLLDRSLNDALEKMDNQMSIEDALKETLSELQSKLNLKLDRNDLDSLRDQLESRIREIQVIRTTIKEKAEDAEPAGFRRNVKENVHCISCDRPLEVQPGGEKGPNMPKMQGMPGQKSSKPYTTYELEHIRQHQKVSASRRAVIGADLGYHAQKLKGEVVAMTGLVDLIDLPPSQRYCGGSHTIMHPFRRSFKSTGSHFNQYVVIREDGETTVSLPKRDFIVPKESQIKRYMKPKLPAIGANNSRVPSPPAAEYDADYSDRPASAPATPQISNNPKDSRERKLSESQSIPPSPPPDRFSTPTQIEQISVIIPSEASES